MVSAPVRRLQIAYVCQRGRSLRRACALLSVARSTARYRSRLAARDAPAVAVMHELAAQYPRYGYRRIQVFLERRGHVMSPDRAHRLWGCTGCKCRENGHDVESLRADRDRCRPPPWARCGRTTSCSMPVPMGSS